MVAAAIAVAPASFIVLGAAEKTSELRVRGSVSGNYRTAYDILVRPRGSVLPLERSRGLVRDNYLSGLFGGISLSQYRTIATLPGVAVAAPVADIGYSIPSGVWSFDLNGLLDRHPRQLYRITFTTVAQDGTSRYPLWTSYVYYTPRKNSLPCTGPLLNLKARPSPYWTNLASLGCFSGTTGHVQAGAQVFFPILLAAIDPRQEAHLVHLDRSIVAGRYLHEEEGPQLQSTGGGTYHRVVPVIAASTTFIGEHVEARIERLKAPSSVNIDAALAGEKAYGFLQRLRGRLIASRSVGAQRLYGLALGEGAFPGLGGKVKTNISWSYWTSSPVSYRRSHGVLVPETVNNPRTVWSLGPTPGSGGSYIHVSPANADVQFRRLHPRIGSPFFRGISKQVLQTPTMGVVGRYDPARLPGFSPLSRVPLETYYPPEVLPADARTRSLLHDKPLLPTENIADYVAQPPLFLTTLRGMLPFLNSHDYAGASAKAPISVIRIRVKGVAGPDALSQARIRQVATEIHDHTGLQVDITAGSSPERLRVALPAGRYGRPALLLEEGWSKKGVSLSFLRGLDRKRLGLLALILVSCGFFLANGALATVRVRRREIGTLRCLGWPRRAIFSAILAELLLVGVVAGCGAAAISALAATAFALELSWLRLLLVVPLATTLAALAGLIPAAQAARSSVLEALQPPVAREASRRRVRRLHGLSIANVRRAPMRSLAAALGLFVAAAAFTLVFAINSAFRGNLVGTLLGNAVSVQIRGLDFLVVGLIALLAGVALADVLYLNLRERAAELTTLSTVGWSDNHLTQLIGTEAIALSLIGTLPGALLGMLVGSQLGVPTLSLVAAAAISVGAGGLLAIVASLLSLSHLGGFTAPAVLGEE